jgi:hypothetical protein
MAIRFVLNNKLIWDNTDFENLLFSDLLDQTDSYLPVRQINNEVVTVGGWRTDVQSTINWNGTTGLKRHHERKQGLMTNH